MSLAFTARPPVTSRIALELIISSLYEHFPGKDAIVALVAERLVERVLARLEAGLSTVTADGDDRSVRRWIGLIHRTVVRERDLVRVFREQVPYTDVLPASRTLAERLIKFSLDIQQSAGDFVHPDFNPATLQLVVNLVTSTILQLALDPPRRPSQEALLNELATRIEGWIRRPAL